MQSATEGKGTLKVHKWTKRFFIAHCTYEEGQDFVRMLNGMHLPAKAARAGAFHAQKGLFTVNLQWPNQKATVEIINTAIQNSSHEFIEDAT
jgi:hypothetical protein